MRKIPAGIQWAYFLWPFMRHGPRLGPWHIVDRLIEFWRCAKTTDACAIEVLWRNGDGWNWNRKWDTLQNLWLPQPDKLYFMFPFFSSRDDQFIRKDNLITNLFFRSMAAADIYSIPVKIPQTEKLLLIIASSTTASLLHFDARLETHYHTHSNERIQNDFISQRDEE